LNALLNEAGIGVAHHQVDVFLFEPGSDRYLGRLCHFGTCPKGKPECRVPGCGAAPFLRQHEDFVFDPRSLEPARCAVLFALGARLGRGRSYARRGQVLDVAIERGLVEARVQGSRPAPYKVSIKVKTLSGAQWKRASAALAREARFAAKLLAFEMPEDVEKAFEGAGLSLFPERRKDLTTECSCPDWSNPCKHIAAVYY